MHNIDDMICMKPSIMCISLCILAKPCFSDLCNEDRRNELLIIPWWWKLIHDYGQGILILLVVSANSITLA